MINMNWYKKAITYMDIGHSRDKIYYLWSFHGGELIVKPNMMDNKEVDHNDFWENNQMESTDYRGRFDPERKIVSVLNPFPLHHVPEYITEKLKDEFGYDIKIMEFE
jgi:hypothetical protein